jgi:SET domain
MRKTVVTSSSVEVVSQHIFADVWLNASTHQRSLHAATAFKPGQVITKFLAGVTQSYATYLTIQTGIDKHITLQPDCLQYINHSCNPTTFFDTAAMELICIKPIDAGDELSFFYPGTEWEMSRPFVCNCQSKDCLQLINGAAHLDKSTAEKYRLTDFIKRQLAQRIFI